jgi:dTMP kinase
MTKSRDLVTSVKKRLPVWYGHSSSIGIPYLKDVEISGRLIVVEGPDASGRSTQIDTLTSRLEADGFAVLNTGLKRSDLIGEGILEAKRNVSLGKRTLALFYAADFADQLEHKIIPALQAGYVVLADRYIYTLIARNTVRGIKRNWSSDLYSFALVPDLVFYLDVDPFKLVHRVFEKRLSLDYYESGADLGLSDDMFESFILYQSKLANEFSYLKKQYNLITIDGNKSTEQVNKILQNQISRYLAKCP